MADAQELPVPPEADEADDAVELFRGWLIDNRLACSLLPGAFEDPAVWGVLLADAAHHIANALADAEGADQGAVLKAITEAFAVEMQAPTDAHDGEFVEPEPPE